MTPAIKLLTTSAIDFKVYEYQHDTRADSYGLEAAEKLGVDAEQVFKTLLVSLPTAGFGVALVPVNRQLSLKKAAAVFGSKKATLANANDVHRSTGYVLGGVSPLGQSRSWPTVIDLSANEFETIFISAGKRGLEIELSASALAVASKAVFADIAS